jgi:murein DD-endopeptidase MepM/ murein hydrolase activator NlpD
MRRWSLALLCAATVAALPAHVALALTQPSPGATRASDAATRTPLPGELEVQLLTALGAAARRSADIERALTEAQAKEAALALEVFKAGSYLAEVRAQHAAVRAHQRLLTARLRTAEHAYAGLARTRYKQQRTWLTVLVDAGDFRSFVERMGYLAVARGRERTLAQHITADRNAVRHSAATLARLERRADADLVLLERAKTDLLRQQTQQQELLAALHKSIRSGLAILTDKSPSDPAVARARAELTLAQTRALSVQAEAAIWAQAAPLGGGLATTEAGVTITAASLRALAGNGRAVLRWPVPNAVLTQMFGPSPYFFEPAYASYPHFHAGLDLAAPSGTPVLSAAEGVVLLATAQRVGDRYAGYGNYVVIEHAGGLRTLYAHLLGSVVQPREQVHAGQVLGFMGSTGNSTGPHTHFEARVDNTPIDPMILLPAAR